MALFKKPRSPYFWYDLRVDGKRYRGSTGEKTKAAAGTFEARVLLKLQARQKPTEYTGKMPTLREMGKRFLAWFNMHQQRDADTKRYYRFGMDHLMATDLADLPLDHITPSVVSTIPFPHSGSTGNAAIRTLSRTLSYAVDLKILNSKPRFSLFKENERNATFESVQEAKILHIANANFRLAFLFWMDAGLRPCETFPIEWAQFTWERRTVWVRDSKSKAGRRYIVLSDRLYDECWKRYQARKSEKFAFPGRRRKGKPETHLQSLHGSFRGLRDKLNLPLELKMYSARHTFGTDLMMMTGNPKLVMETMGHRELKTSARYQHPSTAGVATAINARNSNRSANVKSATNLAVGHTFGHTTQTIQ